MEEKRCPFSTLEQILLCTDGSEYSNGAVREAINLAARCSIELYAMSVVETNVEFSALAPELVEKAELRAREHLEAVRDQAEAAGAACETIVHEGGTVWPFIVDEGDERDASLIVMGRRGHSAAQKIVVGSVTARVIGHTSRPVLVAPRAAAINCGKALLATDGSPFSLEAARLAVDYAGNCGASLVVVSVAGDSSELSNAEGNIRQVAELAGHLDVAVESVALVGKPHEAIVHTATEHGVELIFVGSHGRTGLDRLLMGSVAERVIDGCGCAVLVAR